MDVEPDSRLDARRSVTGVQDDLAGDIVPREEVDRRRHPVRVLGQTEGPVEHRRRDRRGGTEHHVVVFLDLHFETGSLGRSPFGADGRPVREAEPAKDGHGCGDTTCGSLVSTGQC